MFDHLEDALTDWFDSIDKHFTQCNKFGRTITHFKEALIDAFEVRAEEYDYNLLWDMERPEYPNEEYLDYIKALKKALDEHVEVTEEIVKDMK